MTSVSESKSNLPLLSKKRQDKDINLNFQTPLGKPGPLLSRSVVLVIHISAVGMVDGEVLEALWPTLNATYGGFHIELLLSNSRTI